MEYLEKKITAILETNPKFTDWILSMKQKIQHKPAPVQRAVSDIDMTETSVTVHEAGEPGDLPTQNDLKNFLDN